MKTLIQYALAGSLFFGMGMALDWSRSRNDPPKPSQTGTTPSPQRRELKTGDVISILPPNGREFVPMLCRTCRVGHDIFSKMHLLEPGIRVSLLDPDVDLSRELGPGIEPRWSWATPLEGPFRLHDGFFPRNDCVH